MSKHVLVLSNLLLLGAAADNHVLFQEDFAGKLQSGWEWIRGDAAEWQIHDGALQVRAQAGHIWGGRPGNDAKNVLVRKPPKAQDVEARVHVAHRPHEKYEQAGLLWYVDDDNFVKFISEHIDGKMYAVIAREQKGRGRVFGKVVAPSADMQLRLIVRSNHVTGQWRIKETDAWSDCGGCDFEAAADPRFGLFTQNGPRDQVRWVRFSSFVILDAAP